MLDYAQGHALAAVHTSIVQRRVSPGFHVVAAAAVGLRALGESDVFFVEEVNPTWIILPSVQVTEMVNDLGRDWRQQNSPAHKPTPYRPTPPKNLAFLASRLPLARRTS